MRTGLAGFAGVVAFGAYNYKNRGTMATSMYLMQLRVAAQGTVVGIISIGLFYQIYTRLNHMWFAEDQSKTSTNKKGMELVFKTKKALRYSTDTILFSYRCIALNIYYRYGY